VQEKGRASVSSAWSLLPLWQAPAAPKAPASPERFRGKLDALHTLRESGRRWPTRGPKQVAASTGKKIELILAWALTRYHGAAIVWKT
jgi:hypothetical protein